MNINFDDYSKNYKQVLIESTGDSIDSAAFYAKQKVKHLIQSLGRSSVAEVNRILDFGCGVGLSLKSLQAAFPNAQVVGTDPSQRCLDQARNEHAESSINLLNYEAVFNDSCQAKYDLIFISCVFHHIEQSEHVPILRSLLALCKPSGMLAIFEHNPGNPVTRKIVRDCPFDEGVTLISPNSSVKRLSGQDGVLSTRISSVSSRLD